MKTQKQEIDHVATLYPESCSICRKKYDDYDIVYTVFGYDYQKKMQVTSACCVDKIDTPVLLGVCGYYDPEEIHNILESHPMADEFFKGKLSQNEYNNY